MKRNPNGLYVPMTPSEKRRKRIHKRSIPLGHPLYQQMREMPEEALDPELVRRAKEATNRAEYTTLSGSGLPMSNHLRELCLEYASRGARHAISLMPKSFNLGEPFVEFTERLFLWDLLPEKEHFLYLNDFYSWYGNQGKALSNHPGILESLIDGQIYSFSMVNDANASRIKLGRSELVIAGVALVRREGQVAVMMLCGEDPPCQGRMPDEYDTKTIPGKEPLEIHSDWDRDSRFLPWLPGLGRLYLGMVFNPKSLTYGHRYVFRDQGPSFDVITDDLYEINDAKFVEHVATRLEDFHEAFSALTALLLLPTMFVENSKKQQVTKFVTKLGADKKTKESRKLIKAIGKDLAKLETEVTCLPQLGSDGGRVPVVPPQFKFEVDAYWKNIGEGEIGRDEKGNPVVGRTWVEKSEESIVSSPSEFMLSIDVDPPDGLNPGVVYVMRSRSHRVDVYKVGLTRRDEVTRAKEVSSATGVPSQFEALVVRNVGDCIKVEKEVHQRLDVYRVNPRREFFKCPIDHIATVLDEVIKNVDG